MKKFYAVLMTLLLLTGLFVSGVQASDNQVVNGIQAKITGVKGTKVTFTEWGSDYFGAGPVTITLENGASRKIDEKSIGKWASISFDVNKLELKSIDFYSLRKEGIASKSFFQNSGGEGGYIDGNVVINNQKVAISKQWLSVMKNGTKRVYTGYDENLLNKAIKPGDYVAIWDGIILIGKNAEKPLTVDPDVNLVIKGETVTQKGLINYDRTLVPIRVVSEKLGGEVLWDADERRVTISYKSNNGDTIIDLKIGARQVGVRVGGPESTIQYTDLDVPAEIINGTTYVPIRFIASCMNLKTSWEGQTRRVTIEAKDSI